MKFIISIAILAILPFTFTQTTCGNNPLISELETLANDLKTNTDESASIQEFLD